MNPFFAYLIKSSISLALLYILFRLLTRNDKSHSINRFLLLGILFISATIPFLNIQFFYEEIPLKQVEVFREFVSAPVFLADVSPIEILPVQESNSWSFNPFLVFYLSVIIVLLTRLLISVFRVLQIIQQAEKQRFRKIFLAVVKDIIQPFSFLNKIVISKKDYTENKDIVVTHEHAHIKQLHAIDLVVCEVFTVLQFFNPFMWMLRHDLKLIHEYQADQAVLSKGIDAKKYQLLVLEKSVGERRFAMANNFTQKPILKRLKMMQKKNKTNWKGVKLFLFIPTILILLQAFAQPEILVEKASVLVPDIIQKDSSEIWLKQWTTLILENLSTFEREYKMDSKGSGKAVAVIIIRNCLNIYIDRDNKLRYGPYNFFKKERINSIVQDFLNGKHPRYQEGPEYITKNLPLVGEVQISKGEVFLGYHDSNTKEIIDFAVKSIGKAYLEKRKEMALDKFEEDYFSLNVEKKSIIDHIIPIRVSIRNTPPPPDPIFVLKLYSNKITLWSEEISMSDVSKKASEFIKKTEKNVFVRVDIGKDVMDERINAIKEELRKAGALNVNLRTMK